MTTGFLNPRAYFTFILDVEFDEQTPEEYCEMLTDEYRVTCSVQSLTGGGNGVSQVRVTGQYHRIVALVYDNGIDTSVLTEVA